MKVILTQDIKALGKKDAAVEVNDGYARNYLIPKGLAVEGNSTNMHLLKNRKISEEKKKQHQIDEATTLLNKLQAIELKMKTKAGENGKLFGSITSKEVCQKLEEQHGLVVDKRKVHLDEAIKAVGQYTVMAKLYPGIVAKFKVTIEAE